MVLAAMREANASRRQMLLHKLFDGYEATTDFPGSWFITDLMDMYPDAAIVLNQRKSGGEGWMKSFQDSLGLFMSLKYYVICLLHRSDRLHYDIHSVARAQFIPRYGVLPSPEFYAMYQDLVLREAEKRGRKVLTWTVEDGWDPLCRFLEKPVPKNEPFPWVNDAATMRNLKMILLGRGILSWVALFGVVYALWMYGAILWGLLMTRMVKLSG